MTETQPTREIIGAAIEVHKTLGPGLLESAYEERLAHELTPRRLPFERQKPLSVVYNDVKLECGCRIDLLVRGRVVVELKAVEALSPIHDAVLLAYLRLSGCAIGLLINFNAPILKAGIRRLVNDYIEEPHRGAAERAEKISGGSA
jgi:GxxExxY protein